MDCLQAAKQRSERSAPQRPSCSSPLCRSGARRKQRVWSPLPYILFTLIHTARIDSLHKMGRSLQMDRQQTMRPARPFCLMLLNAAEHANHAAGSSKGNTHIHKQLAHCCRAHSLQRARHAVLGMHHSGFGGPPNAIRDRARRTHQMMGQLSLTDCVPGICAAWTQQAGVSLPHASHRDMSALAALCLLSAPAGHGTLPEGVSTSVAVPAACCAARA